MTVNVKEGSIQLRVSETEALSIKGITSAQEQAIAQNTNDISELESTTQSHGESISSLQGTVGSHTTTLDGYGARLDELEKLTAGTVVTARVDYSADGYVPADEADEDKKMEENIIYRIPFNKSDVFIPAKVDDPENTVTDRNVAYLKFVKLVDNTVEVIVERYEIKMNYDDIPTLDGQNNFQYAPTTDEVQDLTSLGENKLVKGSTVKTYVDAEINKVNQSAAKKVVYVESKPESMESYEIGQIVAYPTV